MVCVALELIIDVVRRRFWARPIDIWQEVEMERRKNKGLRRNEEQDEDEEGEDRDDEVRMEMG
jgi:hypothetical protein